MIVYLLRERGRRSRPSGMKRIGTDAAEQVNYLEAV
jgi:hypothetical protein